MKKKLKRKGFEAGGVTLSDLTSNYITNNIMGGQQQPFQAGKTMPVGYKKGGRTHLNKGSKPEKEYDNDHHVPEDFDDSDTMHGMDPDTLKKYLGFKKGGFAKPKINYKKGGKAISKYKEGGSAKNKFIARGCGKVMQDRRKITKVY